MTGEPLGPDDRVVLVTTRSRLRAARHFPAVLRASLRVRRQMAVTEGLVCGASMTAGPTEFWTITVWRSRHAMQAFTRDGAHGLVMWNYPRWLRSLWLMRWRPHGTESGSWNGVTLAPGSSDAQEASGVPAAVPVPATVPELGAAMGTRGAPTYDSSPLTRLGRNQVRSVRGALIRIRPPLWRVPGVLIGLRRLRDNRGLLRGAVGMGRPGEVFFLGIWDDAAEVERFLAQSWLADAARRWPEGFWSLSLAAEGEFGTWDGQRLRRGRRRPQPLPESDAGTSR